MSIVRAARKDNYYILPTNVINDDRLSWEARGILVYLLSKPDHWNIRIKDLMARTQNCLGKRSGRDRVYSLLTELQMAGYIVRHFDRTGGTFKSVSYEVYDAPNLEAGAAFVARLEKAKNSPFPDLPDAVPPLTDLPDTAAPFTANPDALDSSETASNLEKAVKTSSPSTAPVEESPQALTLTDAEQAALAQAPQNYPQSPASPTFWTWLAYAMGFKARYKQWPVYNAAIGSQLAKLLKRVGADCAPPTARYYVEAVNTPAIIDNHHPISSLLRHCESYVMKAQAQKRTQAVRTVTEHLIRAAEQVPPVSLPVPDTTASKPSITRAAQQARAEIGKLMGGELKSRLTA